MKGYEKYALIVFTSSLNYTISDGENEIRLSQNPISSENNTNLNKYN